MSPVREGPEIKLSARGVPPCPARINANASSMPDTRRSARTIATCVSGNIAVAVGVAALDVMTIVPVSAIAQKEPVMPKRSLPNVGRDSIESPAADQSSVANSGQQTPTLG